MTHIRCGVMTGCFFFVVALEMGKGERKVINYVASILESFGWCDRQELSKCFL